KLDWHHGTIQGRWLSGGEPGVLGGPSRHLCVAWFEGDRVHTASVREDGTLTGAKVFVPLAPVPGFPYELELTNGGWGNTDGYSPSFPRTHMLLPAFDPRFAPPRATLDPDPHKLLPIQEGTGAFSGTHIVYAFRSGAELQVRSARCEPGDLRKRI